MYRGTLVCEGSSDRPLAQLLQRLAHQVDMSIRVESPDLARVGGGLSVADKVRSLWKLDNEWPDVLFVHRDADKAGIEARRGEILDQIQCVDPNLLPRTVCVVPQRMTETWLLLDPSAISRVGGHKNTKAPRGFPKPKSLESIGDPKQVLRDHLVPESLYSARQRKKQLRRFGDMRAQLFEHIDTEGAISALPSWVAVRNDIVTVRDYFSSGEHTLDLGV